MEKSKSPNESLLTNSKEKDLQTLKDSIASDAKKGHLKIEKSVRENTGSSLIERAHSSHGKELADLTRNVINTALEELDHNISPKRPKRILLAEQNYIEQVHRILEKSEKKKINPDTLFAEIEDYFGKHFISSGIATTKIIG